ncbi:DegQ family serine endoprotease [Acidisphaera sp. L21]|uniref:DegQ family serine endoprotease n=1 Tax=Acidisphaera sp. L21 TaxID=1641851 RepID=UPI00131E9C2A|nr:DegQ family serine endoprotease [Acidisphaera sp. L21]
MRLLTLRAAALATALTPIALPIATVVAPFTIPHAQARGAPESFADLSATLLPAVVNISSQQAIQAKADRPDGPGAPQFPQGSPFEQFFRDFMERHGAPGGGGGNGGGGQNRGDNGGGGGGDAPQRRGVALGSGFIIDPAGYIVTNNHVIEGADEITVTLHDGTSLKAKLIGHDDRTDVALLKVESPTPLPAVPFADSDTARVGDWVIAIGNPFGLGGSVTAGIVSARGRDIRQGPYDDFIQTDAAINRGNSGGPLFNMDGQVIGINTAIYSPSGGSIGIGFSIPSNMAKQVVAQLKDFGHAKRGWLGVQIQQVTPDIADGLGLKPPHGAMVASVTDDGPAAKAQIHGGDVILKFNGMDVKEMRTLPRVVAETEIGKQVPVVVWRDNKELTLQASIAELPDDVQQASATPTPAAPPKKPADDTTSITGLGMKVATITTDLRTKYNIGADQKGVVVTDITANSPAAQRGVKPGDVVVEVQQESVATGQDVLDRVEKYRKMSRKTVLMLVQNTDGLRWVPIALSSDAKGG